MRSNFSKSISDDMNSLFASTARGLEELLKTELDAPAWVCEGLLVVLGRGDTGTEFKSGAMLLYWCCVLSSLPGFECRWSKLGAIYPAVEGRAVILGWTLLDARSSSWRVMDHRTRQGRDRYALS